MKGIAKNFNLEKSLERLKNNIEKKMKFPYHLKAQRITEANKITIYHEGKSAFEAMWHSITTAKKRVWIETYILDPDEVGRKTIDLLESAALRGCEVVLLYDYVGSTHLSRQYLQPLYDAQAHVVCFHPLFGRFRNFSEWQWPLYRTHRKILIIDDDVAFCGGMNISADYAGTLGNNRFRDTHCKIIGSAALDLQEVFLKSMKVASKELWVVLDASQRRYMEGLEEEKKLTIKKLEEEEKGVSIQVLQSDVLNNKKQIQKALTYAISRSQRYCHITSPYFLPPKKLRNSLIHSSKRGVDITIITQGVCTTPIISEATQYISSYFIRHGIKIYRLDNQELHAKTLVTDDYYSTLGTFNFDHLSFKYLLEVNVAVTDPEVAKIMEDQFQEDLKHCTLVTLEKLEERSWWTKLFHWLCYHFTVIVCR